jgi:hypothetical protein
MKQGIVLRGVEQVQPDFVRGSDSLEELWSGEGSLEDSHFKGLFACDNVGISFPGKQFCVGSVSRKVIETAHQAIDIQLLIESGVCGHNNECTRTKRTHVRI